MKYLSLILSLIPQLMQIILAIESATGPGNGPAKLAAVTSIVEATVPEVSADALPALEKTVGAIVTLYNKTGVFKPAVAAAT